MQTLLSTPDTTLFALLTTEELASQFKISVSSLRRNRKQANKIPFRKCGRLIRYQRNDVVAWLGNDDLTLLTPAEMMSLFKFTYNWLNYNRRSDDPIPYRKIGSAIRYHRVEVEDWIAKHSK